MKINHVLIDLENVTPDSLHLLAGDHFKVHVFVGENQKKIPIDLATAVQRMGSNARYVQIVGNGPNALDFHIAYYIGRLSLETPGAFFHIISRDTGFDPLKKHLKDQGVYCLRHESLADIPLVRRASSTLEEKVLAKPARPKSSAALRRRVNAAFSNALSESELDELLRELARRSLLQEKDGKVTYAAAGPAQN